MIFKKKRNQENINHKEETKINYSELFHKKYDLACSIRNIPWQYTYCAIKENEKVLLQGCYRLDATDDKGWYGQKYLHFYVVERKSKKYLKVVDLHPINDELFTCETAYSWSFIPACERFDVGVFMPEHKEFVDNILEEYELNSRIDDLLKEMSKIDFEKYYLEDFTCKYDISLVRYDCYDFVNKHSFVADGYCLKKYSPYIDLLDYIFALTQYKYLVPSAIKKIDSLEEAYEEMVKRKIEIDEFDMMIE